MVQRRGSCFAIPSQLQCFVEQMEQSPSCLSDENILVEQQKKLLRIEMSKQGGERKIENTSETIVIGSIEQQMGWQEYSGGFGL